MADDYLLRQASVSTAASHRPVAPIPATRMPRPTSSYLTRDDRLQIYLDINTEIASDRQHVFVCYVCELFEIGRTCFTHHTRLCLRNHPHSRDSHPLGAPTYWRWLNCGFCFSQEVLARQYDYMPYVSHVTHWAGLVIRLIRKRSEPSAWNCSARHPHTYFPFLTPCARIFDSLFVWSLFSCLFILFLCLLCFFLFPFVFLFRCFFHFSCNYVLSAIVSSG